MKTLVVYYSLEGNTKFAAEKIVKEMNADILSLEPEKAYPTGKVTKFIWGGRSAMMGEQPTLKPYQIDLSFYDTIVLGTPIWAGTFAPPLRTFIKENEIKQKKIRLFACCAGGPTDKCFAQLQEMLPDNEFGKTLRLVDPLKGKTENLDEKIDAFCKSE